MEPLEITKGVWLFTSALYQTTCTIIKTEHEIFVVDPNWLPHEVSRIKSFVDQHKDDRKMYLIFTHSDYDHIVGYGAFQPDSVIASEAFVQNTQKDEDVRKALHFDQSHYISRDYMIIYPHVDIMIAHDGQTLQFNDTIMTFYLAPGHTDQGLFIIVEPQGVWIAGDYLSDIEFPLISGSLIEYHATLNKVDGIMREHGIQYLVPGHGTVENSVSGIEIRKAHALEYLDDIEACISKDIPFPEEVYRKRYPFWEGIRDWHQENIDHLRKQHQAHAGKAGHSESTHPLN
jgi:glyoxylase-like metal-dependent hydrolase (beta-lactamase superfamily II)